MQECGSWPLFRGTHPSGPSTQTLLFIDFRELPNIGVIEIRKSSTSRGGLALHTRACVVHPITDSISSTTVHVHASRHCCASSTPQPTCIRQRQTDRPDSRAPHKQSPRNRSPIRLDGHSHSHTGKLTVPAIIHYGPGILRKVSRISSFAGAVPKITSPGIASLPNNTMELGPLLLLVTTTFPCT